MRKLIIMAALAITASASAQTLKVPAPSPTQTLKQDFGLGTIELSYSRPSAKGRTIMGELVPYGKVWRTGANAATTIQFSDDVIIESKEIKAGKYGLLTIPGEKTWIIILTKDLNVNAPSMYKQENDVMRATVPVNKTDRKTETFTMQFENITNSTCNLHLCWENTSVTLPISTNVDTKVMAQIDNIMSKDGRPYFLAAQYYFENNKDLSKAKEWVDKAAEANTTAFWIYLLKARIYAKAGDKKVAKAAAEKCIVLATEAKNDDYIKMATELIKKL